MKKNKCSFGPADVPLYPFSFYFSVPPRLRGKKGREESDLKYDLRLVKQPPLI